MKLVGFPQGSSVVGPMIVAPYEAVEVGSCEQCGATFQIGDEIFGLHAVLAEGVVDESKPQSDFSRYGVRVPDPDDYDPEVEAVVCSRACAREKAEYDESTGLYPVSGVHTLQRPEDSDDDR